MSIGKKPFLKGPFPASFFVYFRLFKQTLEFVQQINVIKCPSSIWCWDSNPRPSEHVSIPISTRPGLPHWETNLFSWPALSESKSNSLRNDDTIGFISHF